MRSTWGAMQQESPGWMFSDVSADPFRRVRRSVAATRADIIHACRPPRTVTGSGTMSDGPTIPSQAPLTHPYRRRCWCGLAFSSAVAWSAGAGEHPIPARFPQPLPVVATVHGGTPGNRPGLHSGHATATVFTDEPRPPCDPDYTSAPIYAITPAYRAVQRKFGNVESRGVLRKLCGQIR